jgi:hypothetical protein
LNSTQPKEPRRPSETVLPESQIFEELNSPQPKESRRLSESVLPEPLIFKELNSTQPKEPRRLSEVVLPKSRIFEELNLTHPKEPRRLSEAVLPESRIFEELNLPQPRRLSEVVLPKSQIFEELNSPQPPHNRKLSTTEMDVLLPESPSDSYPSLNPPDTTATHHIFAKDHHEKRPRKISQPKAIPQPPQSLGASFNETSDLMNLIKHDLPKKLEPAKDKVGDISDEIFSGVSMPPKLKTPPVSKLNIASDRIFPEDDFFKTMDPLQPKKITKMFPSDDDLFKELGPTPRKMEDKKAESDSTNKTSPTENSSTVSVQTPVPTQTPVPVQTPVISSETNSFEKEDNIAKEDIGAKPSATTSHGQEMEGKSKEGFFDILEEMPLKSSGNQKTNAPFGKFNVFEELDDQDVQTQSMPKQFWGVTQANTKKTKKEIAFSLKDKVKSTIAEKKEKIFSKKRDNLDL